MEMVDGTERLIHVWVLDPPRKYEVWIRWSAWSTWSAWSNWTVWIRWSAWSTWTVWSAWSTGMLGPLGQYGYGSKVVWRTAVWRTAFILKRGSYWNTLRIRLCNSHWHTGTSFIIVILLPLARRNTTFPVSSFWHVCGEACLWWQGMGAFFFFKYEINSWSFPLTCATAMWT